MVPWLSIFTTCPYSRDVGVLDPWPVAQFLLTATEHIALAFEQAAAVAR